MNFIIFYHQMPRIKINRNLKIDSIRSRKKQNKNEYKNEEIASDSIWFSSRVQFRKKLKINKLMRKHILCINIWCREWYHFFKFNDMTKVFYWFSDFELYTWIVNKTLIFCFFLFLYIIFLVVSQNTIITKTRFHWNG